VQSLLSLFMPSLWEITGKEDYFGFLRSGKFYWNFSNIFILFIICSSPEIITFALRRNSNTFYIGSIRFGRAPFQLELILSVLRLISVIHSFVLLQLFFAGLQGRICCREKFICSVLLLFHRSLASSWTFPVVESWLLLLLLAVSVFLSLSLTMPHFSDHYFGRRSEESVLILTLPERETNEWQRAR